MSKKQRHTYKFNPHTLRYERVIVSLRERVKKFSFSMLLGIVTGVIIVVVAMQAIETPKERAINAEMQQYRQESRQMTSRLERAEKVLNDIEERDDNLYRIIMESEPVSHDPSPYHLADRNADSNVNETTRLMRQTSRRIDDLTSRLYVESKSIDELFAMARVKGDRMRCMPAIMPIAKNKCKVVSGFGMRMHPILKYRRLHSGIDFTARQDTPIYATADGTVVVAGKNMAGYTGYGTVVVIDHGYGFQTLYAHMHTAKVRAGQKVQRGTQIGTVGNSGLSSGTHLHYEVIQNGKKIDPIYFFFNDLTADEYEEVLELARRENQSMS